MGMILRTLKNKLHHMVCNGDITLAEAEKAIAEDWIAAYRKYVGPEPSTGGKPTD